MSAPDEHNPTEPASADGSSSVAPPSGKPRRRWLLIALRILIAAAGISYVLFSLTWTDRVIVTSIRELDDGTEMTEESARPVIEGEMTLDGAATDLTIPLSPNYVPGDRVIVVAREVIQAGEGYRADPGILTMFRHAKVSYLLIGLALIFLILPMQAVRWQILLRARGLPVSIWRTFRLVMAGMFFNLCLPGMTGGDVVKAYYAAKRTERRTDAVMSVIFDRLSGLMALVLLGGIAGLFMLENDVARRITVLIWIGIGCGAIGAFIYFNTALRRRLGVEWLLDRMPGRTFFRKVDSAAVAYRDHKGAVFAAVLITLPGHLASVTATALAGYALGMEAPFLLMVTVVPVLLLGGAVPLTYQGLGVMEALGGAMLLNPPGVVFNQIAGMLLIFRLYQITYALIGATWVLRGDIHMHPEQEAGATGQPPLAETTPQNATPSP